MFVRPRSFAPFPLALLLTVAGCGDDPLGPAPSIEAASSVPAGRQTFSGALCATDIGEPEWLRQTRGGVIHSGGGTAYYALVTGNPLLDGLLQSTGSLHANLARGIAQERASVVVFPDAFPDGTWEIVNILRTRPYSGGRTARGTGRGTGALAGLTLTWQWEEGAGIPEECESVFVISGTITRATLP